MIQATLRRGLSCRAYLAAAGVLLMAVAGCEDQKAPPASEFAAARTRLVDSLAAFEAHLWDADGAERRKALDALDTAAAALSRASGYPADLPPETLAVSLRKLTTEAHSFSTMIGRQESTGKPPESGLPWPYEYREAAAKVRTLLQVSASPR